MPPQRRSALPTVTTCDGCGVCCLHMGYPAFLHGSDAQDDEEYWIHLPADLKGELVRYIEGYRPPASGQLDGPCVWLDLDSGRCRHHRYRPRVCRDFPVGSRGCLDWRRHYRDRLSVS